MTEAGALFAGVDATLFSLITKSMVSVPFGMESCLIAIR